MISKEMKSEAWSSQIIWKSTPRRVERELLMLAKAFLVDVAMASLSEGTLYSISFNRDVS